MLLKKNDRVVFLGDSITEQQLYTNYVETYLASRFPELKLTFFNAGWGGDTAPGGLARLQRDVLDLKPTFVTVCYGMNDAGYVFPNPEIEERFTTAYGKLLDRLKASGARVALLTPGFADVEAAPAFLKPVDYSRRGLRRLAEVVLAQARKRKLPVFDLHRLMTGVDRAARKKLGKKFTLAPDGFHPNPAGHLVMAYGLLKALGVPPRHEEARVSAVAGSGGTFKIEKVAEDAHGLSFDVSCRRTPFFVESEARPVMPFIDFQKEFNEGIVSFRGLKKSAYVLSGGPGPGPSRIVSRQELEKGINFFSLDFGGLNDQARTLHEFTREKCQVYYKLWRSLGMSGGYGSYRPEPHALGKKAVEPLDRVRERLALSPQPSRYRLISADFKGEVLGNGDRISLWALKGPGKEKPIPVRLDVQNPANSLGAHLGRLKGVATASTRLASPSAQKAELWVGSSDGFRLTWNGKLLVDKLSLKRPWAADQDRIPVEMKAGRNDLSVEVAQREPAWWGLSVELRGLKKSVEAFHP
jgi:lysophospholipase L1-like esterase